MFQNLNGQKVSPVAFSPVDKVAQAVTNQPTGVDLYSRFALAGAIGVSSIAKSTRRLVIAVWSFLQTASHLERRPLSNATSLSAILLRRLELFTD